MRPAVEKTRPQVTKNPDVDRLEEDVNRMAKRWGNCCMQVVERLRSCEAACELLEKYNMSYQSESNWMDELDSKLRNLEELEAARAKEAWEKHVVSTPFWNFSWVMKNQIFSCTYSYRHFGSPISDTLFNSNHKIKDKMSS